MVENAGQKEQTLSNIKVRNDESFLSDKKFGYEYSFLDGASDMELSIFVNYEG